MERTGTALCVRLVPALLMAIAAGGIAWGSSVEVPHTFVGGTAALAAEVNANFEACESAIDDNDARIAANEGSLDALRGFGAAKAAFHVQSNGTGSPTVRFLGQDADTFAATVIRFSPGRFVFAFSEANVDLAENFLLATISGTTAPATVNVLPNTLIDPISVLNVFTLDASGTPADGFDFFLVIF